MKLLSCHIENFGKISNYDRDFSNGLNVFCENNAWGKSTLATFIRVMFFGFEDENSRNKERNRLSPWNKGTFGGKILFEANGKNYELTKTFGKNLADDSYTLLNADTLLESRDYNPASIGEELFGIDAAGFKRTVFISQDDRNGRDMSKGAENTVNAKIGNLADDTDDINRYEEVESRIKDELNHLSASRKTGEIKKLKSIETELSVNVKDKPTIEKNIIELEKAFEKEKESKASNEEILSKTSEEYKLACKLDVLKERQDKYFKYREDTLKYKEQYDKLNEQFANGIPGQTEIASLKESMSEYDKLMTLAAETALTETEKARFDELCVRFEAGAPSDVEISNIIKRWGDRTNVKADLAGKNRSVEIERKVHIDKDKKNEELLRENRENKKRVITLVSAIIFVIGILILGFGGYNFFSHQFFGEADMIASIVFGAVGVICIIVSIIYKNVNEKKLIRESLQKKEEPKESEYLKGILEDIANDESFISAADNEVRTFIAKYKIPFVEDNVIDICYGLKTDILDYARLTDKNDKDTISRSRREYLKKVIDDFFDKYGLSKQGNLNELFDELSENAKSFKEVKDAYFENKHLLDEFESREDIEEIKAFDRNVIVGDATELERKIEFLTESIKTSDESIASYRKQLDNKREIYESLEEDEAELANIRERIEELSDYAAVLEKTGEFLAEAKQAITTQFTRPVLNGFKKYFAMFDSNTEDYCIDGKLCVLKEEENERRSINSLSNGYRDMVDLSIRLAFCDTMYENEEQPFIVLDDPFVNIDDGKMKGALEFLGEVSKNHQVVYFTCSESRT